MSKYIQSLLTLVNEAQTTNGCLLVGVLNMGLSPDSVCKFHDCSQCAFNTPRDREEDIAVTQAIKILENST
jgi:hypothetical protein